MSTIRDILTLQRHNAARARAPWGGRQCSPRRRIDWYGLVLPAGIVIGASVAGAVLYFDLAYIRGIAL